MAVYGPEWSLCRQQEEERARQQAEAAAEEEARLSFDIEQTVRERVEAAMKSPEVQSRIQKRLKVSDVRLKTVYTIVSSDLISHLYFPPEVGLVKSVQVRVTDALPPWHTFDQYEGVTHIFHPFTLL